LDSGGKIIFSLFKLNFCFGEAIPKERKEQENYEKTFAALYFTSKRGITT
jgi:hypothetical protein